MLTEKEIRQIVKEELRKIVKFQKDTLYETAWGPRQKQWAWKVRDRDISGRVWRSGDSQDSASLEDVSELLLGVEFTSNRDVATEMKFRAFQILADIFESSPDPSLDIAAALMDMGYNEMTALKIGEIVQTKFIKR